MHYRIWISISSQSALVVFWPCRNYLTIFTSYTWRVVQVRSGGLSSCQSRSGVFNEFMFINTRPCRGRSDVWSTCTCRIRYSRGSAETHSQTYLTLIDLNRLSVTNKHIDQIITIRNHRVDKTRLNKHALSLSSQCIISSSSITRMRSF